MNTDNRKDSRHDKFLIAEYKQKGNRGSYFLGTVRNLSPEGFSLESQMFQFERGEVLEFRLTLSRTTPTVIATGEVVWKKQAWYKYISGIRFLDTTEDTRDSIGALMTAVGEDWNDAGTNDEPPDSVQAAGDQAPFPAREKEMPGVPFSDASSAGAREDDALPKPFPLQENGRKRKMTIYAALAAAVIVLLLVLPAAVKRLTTPPGKSGGAISNEAPVRLPDNERAVDAVPSDDQTLRNASVPQETQPSLAGEAKQENKSYAAGTPDNKDLKELIARMDRTLASVREIDQEERREGTAASPEGSLRAEDVGLSENWVRVGSIGDGRPLFIDTANISNPSDNTVKLLIRTFDDEKEYIDLVEIDCARSLLRVIDRLNSNNPATISYSNEWRDIVPESMMLRDAACFARD